MDSKVEMYCRVQATKELHSLSKTSVLLLRDLPFVTNLSKFYDEDILDSNSNNITQSTNQYSNRNNRDIDNNPIDRKDIYKSANLDKSFDSNGIHEGKTLADESVLNVEKKPQSKYKRLDSDVIEDMQRQMHITDSLKDKDIEKLTEEDLDKIITPEHRESVRKLRELLDI